MSRGKHARPGRARLRVATAVGVTGLLVGSAGPALAVSGVQAAYWWSGGSAGAAPQVPAGGLYVSASPSGPQAVSALRFSLGDGESAPTLQLKIAQMESADAAAAAGLNATPVLACPAKGNWKVPDGGAGDLSSAPAADCAKGSVNGELSSDGKTMTFDLSLLDQGDTVDIVLVPGEVNAPGGGTVPGAPTSTYPAFDIAFDKVTAGQVEVRSSGTSGLSGTGAGSPSDAGGPPPPSTQAPPPMPSGAFEPAQPSAPGLDQSPVVAGNDRQPAAPPQLAMPSRPVAAQPVERWDRKRIILVLLVADIGLFYWWDAKRRAESGARPRRNLFDPPPVRDTEATA